MTYRKMCGIVAAAYRLAGSNRTARQVWESIGDRDMSCMEEMYDHALTWMIIRGKTERLRAWALAESRKRDQAIFNAMLERMRPQI